MINFEEELKKFHPSLELDEARGVIEDQDLDDVADVLVDMFRRSGAEGKGRSGGRRERR
ncbi:MAG: hypothetical protein K5696_05705 [Lachnospiraceae bacterium]|nr:hypothetical protein [Lachnospiraceae bacterium]